MKEILKMVFVLSLISGLSGTVLAYLKDATKNRIEEQVLTYVQGPALETVFPEHDNNPIVDRKKFPAPGGEGTITVFPAIKGGELQAVALESFGKGYGGDIGVIVGFDAKDDVLIGIGVTTMKETPGLGTNIAKHGFTSQFKGHHPSEKLDLANKGGDIEAVAGATYSSTGAVAAVQKAAELRRALKAELEKAWP